MIGCKRLKDIVQPNVMRVARLALNAARDRNIEFLVPAWTKRVVQEDLDYESYQRIGTTTSMRQVKYLPCPCVRWGPLVTPGAEGVLVPSACCRP